MLNWNMIFSVLALAFAGFVYALVVCFMFFSKAPFWNTAIALAGALVGTVANYWVLISALPSGSILGLYFLSQWVVSGFLAVFLQEGMYASVFLNAGTLALGIASRYTTFSQQKTLLILVVFVALFIPVWAADFLRRGN